MPEFRNEAGRSLSAPSGSALERQLRKRGWSEVGASPEKPAVPAEPEDDLTPLKRAELDELAEMAGIEDPASLSDKAAVRAAIREAREKGLD